MNLRRYLSLHGESDTWPCPDWYVLMQAAKYLGCPPWELLAQSVWWLDKAIVAMTAEHQAQEIVHAQQGNR